MTANNANNAYLNGKVMTASPQELTLMLYDGAVKFCSQAIRAIENKKVQDAHNSIVKVENILVEFRMTLNKEYEVSNNLDQLYEYMIRRLIEANIKKDTQILEEVHGYLRELRDTWKEAMELVKQPPPKKVVNE